MDLNITLPELHDSATTTVKFTASGKDYSATVMSLHTAEGIQARVINMASVKPLDEAAVVSASKETGAIVTCEEHSIIGGLGSAVAEVLAEQAPAPLERVGVKDTFGESGKPKELLAKYGLTAADVAEAARRVVVRKK